MGNSEPVFPNKYPALFTMLVAFTGIWLFSITDNSATGKKEQGSFDHQFIRSQTGIGAEGASSQ